MGTLLEEQAAQHLRPGLEGALGDGGHAGQCPTPLDGTPQGAQSQSCAIPLGCRSGEGTWASHMGASWLALPSGTDKEKDHEPLTECWGGQAVSVEREGEFSEGYLQRPSG